MTFSAILNEGTGGGLLPDRIRLVPLWYDWIADGGPHEAQIEVYGEATQLWPVLLRLLGRRVDILNKHAAPVWWGYLNEALIQVGEMQIGLSLEDMANRVAVRYQVRNEQGIIIRQTTDWAENTESISAYGSKELLKWLYAVEPERATARRDALLTEGALPLPVYKNATSPNTAPATLRCKGYVHTLDWTYYAQPLGLEANDYDRTGALSGAMQKLGQGFIDSNIGFAQSGKISDLAGRWTYFDRTDTIVVSGSAANDGTYEIAAQDNRMAQQYTATTISFDPADDIHDSAEQLNLLSRDDFFTVTGSASNDDTYRAKSVGGEHVTVTPSTVMVEAAGASVTVARGNGVLVDQALAQEFPGATVTITTLGQKIAQKFSPGAVGSWSVAEVEIRGRRANGSGVLPTDSLKLELCADSAGAPGGVLDSATVDVADILLVTDWITFALSNLDSVTNGTNYWLVLSHTGADDYRDYFEIELNPDQDYPRGGLKLWDGSAWVDRPVPAHLIFRVKGATESTQQISEMVAASDVLTGIDIIDMAGVVSWQYREGLRTAYRELLDLLHDGTSNGRRLLATVTKELRLRIWEQPERATVQPRVILADGQLLNWTGEPLEQGRLACAEWVDLAGVPPTVGYTNRLTPAFVERCVMNCRDGIITPVFYPDSADRLGRVDHVTVEEKIL